MKCPRDQDVTLLMSSRDGVEIDYCPECRGVWLDRGELDKLIERAERDDDRSRDGDRSRADDRGRADDRDDQHRSGQQPKKKKKSFFSEIFEFGD